MTGQPPGGATHWTTRTLAAQVGVSKDTVAQIWADHELKPWKVDVFKLCTDPEFESKLVDVVGLYLNPPDRAVVFSFDEKTQCQALDRTQPSLPLKPGRAGTMTHDYQRHGTIDLFAAMNVGTGQVHTHPRQGHAGKDVLAFFKQIDATVPRGLSIHVILDNLSAHKTPDVRKWLAHKDRRRWHLHFTPTSSSWLNLIERWFKELTDKRLRRGVFTSVTDLTQAITTWAEHMRHPSCRPWRGPTGRRRCGRRGPARWRRWRTSGAGRGGASGRRCRTARGALRPPADAVGADHLRSCPSNPAMTLRVYAHAFAVADQAVAQGIGDLLKRDP